MSDAAIFILIFGGLFVLRLVAATVVFLWILPEGDRCPNCDAVTLHVQATGVDRIFRPRWFRSSWCCACNWEGMLRHGPLTPVVPPAEPLKPARRRTRAPSSS